MKIVIGIIFMTILGACSPSASSLKVDHFQQQDPSSNSVIYGQDNRIDYYEIQDAKTKALARSTVALISNEHLVFDQAMDVFYLENPDLALQMCASEKFRLQPLWAHCSGSLIGPQLVLTAGHCIRDMKSCRNTSFVFDYHLENSNQKLQSVKSENVFSCAEIIYSTEKKSAADFALIRLDRSVPGRAELKLALAAVAYKDSLMMIGHPMGLPTKFTMNGKVRSLINDQYIVASIDSFSGNSGSAVFNQDSLEIVGVLSRGEQDFERSNSCYIAKACLEDSCRGEDITRISEVIQFLPK